MECTFICDKCENSQSVQMLTHIKKNFALAILICIKGHVTKQKLDLNNQNEWAPKIVERLYKCPKCGSELQFLDRRTYDKKTILNLTCSTHGKIPKSIPTSFWLYFIESKKSSKAADKLYCLKCGFPQSVESLVAGKKAALVELSCKSGHSEKQKFELSEQDNWIHSIINGIYTCPKCGLDMIDLDRKVKDNKATLLLNCTVHGKIIKNISSSFLMTIETFKQRVVISPRAQNLEIVVIEESKKSLKTNEESQLIVATLGFSCSECRTRIKTVRCVECGQLTRNVRKCEHCGGNFSYLICRICHTEIPLNDDAVTCPECGKLIKNVRCDECGELNYNVRGCDHCGGEFGNLICGDCGALI